LKFKETLVVFPEVKLGNYKKIAQSVLAERKEVKVEPKEIEDSVKWLLNSRAKISLVSREAKNDDLINIDVEGATDGKPVAGSKIKGDKFILGQGRFLPGFEEKIAGHKAGEELNFTIIAPSDYWKEDLRNKPLDFKVKINGVFERILPELNDDFAKGLGPNFQTVKDLEKSMNEGLLAEKENKEKERLRIKMLDEIIKAAGIDIPEIMIEKTAESMVMGMKQMMGASGKSEEEIKTMIRARAKNNVAANLIIYKIAEAEKLQPTEEEIAAEHARHAGHDHGREFDEKKEYDYSYQIVQNKKVFDFLENLAK
jgi:trigger factor